MLHKHTDTDTHTERERVLWQCEIILCIDFNFCGFLGAQRGSSWHHLLPARLPPTIEMKLERQVLLQHSPFIPCLPGSVFGKQSK